MHLRKIARHLASLICARAFHVAAAPVLICLAAGVGEGAVVTVDGNGFVTAMTGLDVSGTQYDVTFTYNTTFDALYGTGDPPTTVVPTFYNDGQAAEIARDAIRSALIASGTSALSSAGETRLIVPTRSIFNPTLVFFEIATYASSDAPLNWQTSDNFTSRTDSNAKYGFATFSPAAVPEPSTLSLLGLAGAGGLLALRRRRRAT